MRITVTRASAAQERPSARRRRGNALALIALVSALITGGTMIGAQAANALDEPTVPEPVANYFASGLTPRLSDLYGPGKKADSGIVFDASTKVGSIHRIFSWTTEFLARKKTDTALQLTNNWIAPVSVKDQVVGLATVWINPTSDDPELANFDLGPGLATALAATPTGMVIVRDDSHSAWFATDGTKLTPLVSGNSGVATPTTVAAYQKTLSAAPAESTSSGIAGNGLLVAGIVLLAVVILLAVFVLLPDRRRRADRKRSGLEPDALSPAVDPVPDPDPDPDTDTDPTPTTLTDTVSAAIPASDSTPVAVDVQPAAAEPAVTKPAVAKRAVTKPAVTKPAVTKPAVAESPMKSRPAAAKPAAQPAVAVPPAVAKPATAKPATAKPRPTRAAGAAAAPAAPNPVTPGTTDPGEPGTPAP